MKNQITNYKFWLVTLADISLVMLSYSLAYWLRFDVVPDNFIDFWKVTLVPIAAIKLCVFFMFGLHRGMWRYTSLNDIIRIILANFTSTCLVATYFIFAFYTRSFSRGIIIIDFILSTVFISGLRMTIRLLYSRYLRPEGIFSKINRTNRLLIIGAGDTGEKLVREIRNNSDMSEYNVVGFLDDSKDKQGLRIHSVPVLGKIDQINEVIEELEVNEIFIAVSKISGNQMRKIIRQISDTKLPYKIVPKISELLLTENRGIRKVRNVNNEDLLGREPVEIDTQSVSQFLKNKKVLITGAGGSIGSELCRKVCCYKPAEVIMVDQSESNLYEIDKKLSQTDPTINRTMIIADVANTLYMERILGKYKPQILIHAAAYKHVPIVETNILEGIRNNTIATCDLAAISDEYGVERFVYISTDKAVTPVNVMGATKRASEIFIQSIKNQVKTDFMTVRFGNVVGSDGSVVPLFMEQIKKGGPVTVTHPDMTRYFMSIPEAAHLVLQAGAIGNDGQNGKIFILDMGEPVKIMELAEDIIILNGYKPHEEIKIEIIGIRPGEKLDEELLVKGESVEGTHHSKINALKDTGDVREPVYDDMTALKMAVSDFDSKKALEILCRLVPEYTPSNEILRSVESDLDESNGSSVSNFNKNTMQ